MPGRGGSEYLGEGGRSTWERGVGVPGRGGLEYLRGGFEYLGDGLVGLSWFDQGRLQRVS